MALKPQKQAVEPTQPEYQTTPAPLSTIVDIELESAIADELLDSIDWAKVRTTIIRKAPAKLFAWLTRGDNYPVSISPFPEFEALPSRDDEGKAA